MIREDLQLDVIEALWLEVKYEKQKPFLLAYTYRPPTSNQTWVNQFENVLEQVFTENKEILLLGDFNFNLLEDNCSNRNWLQITESANLEQLVDSPTKVTPVSSSLIDHAYSNRAKYIVDVFVPYYALSDHYPVCVNPKVNSR